MSWRFTQFLYGLLFIEVLIFCWIYYFGFHGFIFLREMYQNRNAIAMQVGQLKQEKEVLQGELDSWLSDDFLKEKFARECLHMKKDEEVVYFINQSKKK